MYVEAMALGLPLVAARAGAAPEVIGNAGRLAAPNNPESLAAELDYFLGSTQARRLYAERGRVQAQRFDCERMLDGYEALIDRVTASAGRRIRRRAGAMNDT